MSMYKMKLAIFMTYRKRKRMFVVNSIFSILPAFNSFTTSEMHPFCPLLEEIISCNSTQVISK